MGKSSAGIVESVQDGGPKLGDDQLLFARRRELQRPRIAFDRLQRTARPGLRVAGEREDPDPLRRDARRRERLAALGDHLRVTPLPQQRAQGFDQGVRPEGAGRVIRHQALVGIAGLGAVAELGMNGADAHEGGRRERLVGVATEVVVEQRQRLDHRAGLVLPVRLLEEAVRGRSAPGEWDQVGFGSRGAGARDDPDHDGQQNKTSKRRFHWNLDLKRPFRSR
jgi:hypothetical protein